jgi:hypothetical protein
MYVACATPIDVTLHEFPSLREKHNQKATKSERSLHLHGATCRPRPLVGASSSAHSLQCVRQRPTGSSWR